MTEECYNNDICNFTHMIATIAREVGYSNSEAEKLVKANVEAFSFIISHPMSPSFYFLPIANGSFKETYQPIGDKHKFVIKFISEDNETNLEEEILQLAAEQEVEQFFIPTTYMKLTSCTLPADLIAEDNDDEEEAPLCMICVQPYARPAGDRAHVPLTGYYYLPDDTKRENYRKNPLTYNNDEEVIDFDFANRLNDIIEDYTWWQLALDLYGLAAVEALARFIEDNKITDLHDWNYGYMKKGDKVLPVIMDWLSGF